MGVWIGAKGRLKVVPEPDDNLLIEFWNFNRFSWPDDYKDEKFSNTWFFDENNHLACTEGKFAEPIIWLDWMKENFFETRGYELIGEPEYIGEGDYGFDTYCRKSEEEYRAWKIRVEKLIEDNSTADRYNKF